MYTAVPDVRLSGNSPLVDDLEKALSERGMRVGRYYAWMPYAAGYEYITIEVLKFGVNLGALVLSLFLAELVKRWMGRPRETTLLVEYNDPPMKWSIQGSPQEVKNHIEKMLGRNFLCPYCGLKIQLGRFCNKCGNRLL
jgi:hypothetical protein